MPLFERAILRTGSTNHIGHRPAVALGQPACHSIAGGAAQGAPLQSLFQFDRNFRQEYLLRKRYNTRRVTGKRPCRHVSWRFRWHLAAAIR